jgi:endonuclease/exonuclease/phosphatase family metal-dependent hydrolase
VGTCRRGDGTGEHVAVGYDPDRCRKQASGGFWLSRTPTVPRAGWDGSFPRVATWVRLDFGGRSVLVLATHLDHDGAEARRKGAELLARHVSDRAGPTVLVGDLNATPSDPALEAITDGSLSPARERADAVSGPEETFHGFGTGPHERIDYVLASDGVDVREAGTVDAEPPYPSDHNPVFCDLSLGESPDGRSFA